MEVEEDGEEEGDVETETSRVYDIAGCVEQDAAVAVGGVVDQNVVFGKIIPAEKRGSAGEKGNDPDGCDVQTRLLA